MAKTDITISADQSNLVCKDKATEKVLASLIPTNLSPLDKFGNLRNTDTMSPPTCKNYILNQHKDSLFAHEEPVGSSMYYNVKPQMNYSYSPLKNIPGDFNPQFSALNLAATGMNPSLFAARNQINANLFMTQNPFEQANMMHLNMENFKMQAYLANQQSILQNLNNYMLQNYCLKTPQTGNAYY